MEWMNQENRNKNVGRIIRKKSFKYFINILPVLKPYFYLSK